MRDPPPGDWNNLRLRCLKEAQRVLRNQPEAEDAAQEALLRIWRAGGTESRSSAWLATVGRNEALRLLERRVRVPVPTDPTAAQQLATSDDWEDRLETSLVARQLLASLHPDDRTLLLMRYQEDLTQPEIARRLEIPEGTVKVRLHRLRRTLRDSQRSDDL